MVQVTSSCVGGLEFEARLSHSKDLKKGRLVTTLLDVGLWSQCRTDCLGCVGWLLNVPATG